MTEPHKPEDALPPTKPKTISSQDIFKGEREVCIEHLGTIYRLKITKRGKLLLLK